MKIRIIAGQFKGRLINIPKSAKIRPTTDRVRETLFNLLNNIISFEGIKVLDLYSGSGALGLECLSRGAEEVHFVEKNFFIYKNLIKNIESLLTQNNSKVFNIAALKFTKDESDNSYDLVIADPPFFSDDIYLVVENIISKSYLKKNAIMVIERSIQTKDKDTNNFKTQPITIIGDACLYKIEYQ